VHTRFLILFSFFQSQGSNTYLTFIGHCGLFKHVENYHFSLRNVLKLLRNDYMKYEDSEHYILVLDKKHKPCQL
jgi:hypothetical protein